ncbi:Imm75 family immunity protein [Burkholderia ambifaria]|uniref:Imm75 family immunity protein n=1 Tax=Burkholderia ambifaria TaxID=152480 RepID=UPI0005BB5882
MSRTHGLFPHGTTIVDEARLEPIDDRTDRLVMMIVAGKAASLIHFYSDFRGFSSDIQDDFSNSSDFH